MKGYLITKEEFKGEYSEPDTEKIGVLIVENKDEMLSALKQFAEKDGVTGEIKYYNFSKAYKIGNLYGTSFWASEVKLLKM